MRTLFLAALLALLWSSMTGALEPVTVVAGFVLAMAILWFLRPRTSSRLVLNLAPLPGFLLFFLRELVVSNLRVAWDVITPRHRMKPGVLAIPLESGSDEEIMLLSNIISLTPGTLSLDVSPDRRTLYVHALYVDDPEKVKRAIKEGFEARLRKVIR